MVHFPCGQFPKQRTAILALVRSSSRRQSRFNTGTFTISNLGMFDVAQFDAILPVGQGAILAIGSSKKTVVPIDNAVLGVGVVKQMTVTITCDHRHISGADAAKFLNDLKAFIEAPKSLTK